jgi:hypothetical protein
VNTTRKKRSGNNSCENKEILAIRNEKKTREKQDKGHAQQQKIKQGKRQENRGNQKTDYTKKDMTPTASTYTRTERRRRQENKTNTTHDIALDAEECNILGHRIKAQTNANKLI